jgi:hypothetical protein
MKNKLTDKAKRLVSKLEKTSATEGPKKDQALIVYCLLRFLRFVTTRPQWAARVSRDAKDMAIYEVIFGKQIVRVMLTKSVAEQVMTNREYQSAVQHVWQQACYEVELDPKTYAGVKVPPLHVWRNPARDGGYAVRLEYVRDARPSERKIVGTNPVRELIVGYVDAIIKP